MSEKLNKETEKIFAEIIETIQTLYQLEEELDGKEIATLKTIEVELHNKGDFYTISYNIYPYYDLRKNIAGKTVNNKEEYRIDTYHPLAIKLMNHYINDEINRIENIETENSKIYYSEKNRLLIQCVNTNAKEKKEGLTFTMLVFNGSDQQINELEDLAWNQIMLKRTDLKGIGIVQREIIQRTEGINKKQTLKLYQELLPRARENSDWPEQARRLSGFINPRLLLDYLIEHPVKKLVSPEDDKKILKKTIDKPIS